ncbi:hypothetical protein PV728_29705 [Streptomyces europaeiscabiei]|uniref:hypothetical protein n=1 Tax=Streptomyces europaeiscabiei TaxID=146819 RepID=UPI0029AB2A21|nr:hypothetical protein [Streptomyces europaeiscabiei]MDX3634368.1 hypothetical protein [Streptomyces europaeiscabiei]MDX3651784.1 hypothetical protein [Streptomyces europaeiscabiei]
MSATHSLAEWASVLSLGLVPVGAIWFALAFAPADAAYFDPRPALARAAYVLRLVVFRGRLAVHAARMALESGDWDGLLIAVANVKHVVRPSFEACRDAAALLLLLTTSPKGQLR